jgi:hypothetical protein
METVRNIAQSILPESLTNMSLTQKIETPSITYEQPVGLYIDGKWVKGKEGKTFETINPTNEKPIVAVHEAGPEGEFDQTGRERWSGASPATVLRAPPSSFVLGSSNPRISVVDGDL